MPRTCTICQHPKKVAIETLLMNQTAYRDIARQFSISKDALARHRADHLSASLVEAQKAEERSDAIDVLAELRRCAERLYVLFDAWLRDADDPNRYDLGPRAEEISVTYLEEIDGRKIRKKAKLSELLVRIEGQYGVISTETKHSDPRELVLKTYDRLQGQLELIAKLIGQLDERPQINVLLSPEWSEVRRRLVGSLEAFPDARAAVADALMTLEANGGYRN